MMCPCGKHELTVADVLHETAKGAKTGRTVLLLEDVFKGLPRWRHLTLLARKLDHAEATLHHTSKGHYGPNHRDAQRVLACQFRLEAALLVALGMPREEWVWRARRARTMFDVLRDTAEAEPSDSEAETRAELAALAEERRA